MAHEQLRRMINEPTETTYTDEDLLGYLYENNEDLNAVASIILMEKAAALDATMYNYSTEGERFELSQVIKNMESRAAKYASKRKPQTSQWIKDPEELDTSDELQIG